jgi:hypothetical protein
MAAMVRSLSVLFLPVPNTFFRVLPLLLPMAWMGAVSVPASVRARGGGQTAFVVR